MTAFYLIRHAHNSALTQGRLVGRKEGVHLDAQGQAQAQALADALADIDFAAVYSSPMERAVETAEPIAASNGKRLATRPGLTEIDVGSWEGITLKAARRRKLWPTLQNTPSRARFPGGESFADAQLRMANELEQLRAAHPGKQDLVACVSHADPIKLAIAYYAGLPLDHFQRLIVAPASVSVLWLGEGPPRLHGLNWAL